MRGRLKRAASATLVAGLALTTLPAGIAVAAEAEDPLNLNANCRKALAATDRYDIDTSKIDKGIVTIDNWQVRFTDDRWRAQHPERNLLSRAFHSSAWLIPDVESGVDEAIDLFIEQAVQNPNPVSASPSLRLKRRGWTESHVTWRMKTGLCLYRLGDADQRARLLPALDQLIEANLDPNRYYGPPLRPAHNHGLMADRELLNAARILQRDDLVVLAVARLKAQKAQMYDSCNLNYEQALSYQFLHPQLWRQLERRIYLPKFSAGIHQIVEDLTTAARNLAFPDGTAAFIGDGTPINLDDTSGLNEPVLMWCTDTGWFNRRTVDAEVTQQVIVRFGPRTRLHGHSDKGSFVWWMGDQTSGVPVIVDRGLSKRVSLDERAAAMAAGSHSVFDWRHASDARTFGTRVRSRGVDRITIEADGLPWQREISFASAKRTIRVVDTVDVQTSAGRGTSIFPLDPIWSAASRPGVFRTESGWKLRITCTDSAGRDVPVKTRTAMDYQLTEPRRAITAECSVGDARRGVTAQLTVTPSQV